MGRITTAIVCIASALALPNGFAHATTQALSPNEVDTRASVYWGAHVGDLYGLNSEAPWNMKNAVAFENIAGKKLSLIEFALTWATCSEDDCETVPFPTTQMEAIRGHGAIPVLGWASYAGSLDSERQSAYQLRDIIKGRHDAYIREWAEDARAWGHPFFLRFDWEMNLRSSFPYNESTNGNRRGEFVRAWRHVHRIFDEVGATNASWVWCANAEYPGSIKPLESLYPGGKFVDWSCIDAYNWGANPIQPDVWKSFDEVFSATYRHVARKIAPRKPMMIAETASSELGGDKAAWITDMLRRRLTDRRYSTHLRAFVWFNRFDRGGLDWQIETSQDATAAFVAGISRSAYAQNSFGSLTGPIQPLAPVRHRKCKRRCQLRWASPQRDASRNKASVLTEGRTR